MAHPVMYDEDDPVLARLRENALSFPGAAEKVTHGWPAFYTVKVFGYYVKVFGYYGGSIKIDGTYVRHDQSLLVIPDPGSTRHLRRTHACTDRRTSARTGGSASTSRSIWTGRKWKSSSTRRTGSRRLGG